MSRVSATLSAWRGAARRTVAVGDARIVIHQHFFDTPVPQDRAAPRRADLTGLKVWPCAHRLLARLRSEVLPHVRAELAARGATRPMRVLELGAGTGVLGMGISALLEGDERVLLTDPALDVTFAAPPSPNSAGGAASGEAGERGGGREVGDTLTWLAANVDANHAAIGGRAHVAKCLWGDADDVSAISANFGPVDLVLGSELLYDPDQYIPLLSALASFTADHTLAVLGFSHRHGGEKRFLAAAGKDFELSTKWHEAVDPAPRWAICQLRRRGAPVPFCEMGD